MGRQLVHVAMPSEGSIRFGTPSATKGRHHPAGGYIHLRHLQACSIAFSLPYSADAKLLAGATRACLAICLGRASIFCRGSRRDGGARSRHGPVGRTPVTGAAGAVRPVQLLRRRWRKHRQAVSHPTRASIERRGARQHRTLHVPIVLHARRASSDRRCDACAEARTGVFRGRGNQSRSHVSSIAHENAEGPSLAVAIAQIGRIGGSTPDQ